MKVNRIQTLSNEILAEKREKLWYLCMEKLKIADKASDKEQRKDKEKKEQRKKLRKKVRGEGKDKVNKREQDSNRLFKLSRENQYGYAVHCNNPRKYIPETSKTINEFHFITLQCTASFDIR